MQRLLQSGLNQSLGHGQRRRFHHNGPFLNLLFLILIMLHILPVVFADAFRFLVGCRMVVDAGEILVDGVVWVFFLDYQVFGSRNLINFRLGGEKELLELLLPSDFFVCFHLGQSDGFDSSK